MGWYFESSVVCMSHRRTLKCCSLRRGLCAGKDKHGRYRTFLPLFVGELSSVPMRAPPHAHRKDFCGRTCPLPDTFIPPPPPIERQSASGSMSVYKHPLYNLPYKNDCSTQMTALMGSSGAGKTTLLDVLAGRKTSGTITGDIRLNGHPKMQKTFTRSIDGEGRQG